ncbi:hypothetical protein [Haloarcula nitratireducens]|uniref:Uncharacterized protein n=1 Tax=Haloarcula nitratireducens TaxID=2487749 RepID=A0AAW4PJQ6_9EURY|nr:hypothetical protein [Halomicroarcula nitratireducens]MBX0297883.1 hypothetical protein [Halomicroarcula nitratireducens]
MTAEDSGSTSGLDAVTERASRAVERSSIVGTVNAAAERMGDIIRSSYLYRWLTKEPEPDVIVIDLRETYTVGPIIAVLDRVISTGERAWQHSRIGSIVDRATDRLNETVLDPLSETRGYEVAVSLLTPPELPEENRTEDTPSDEKDR